MRDNRSGSGCDLLIDYLSGTRTEDEKLVFERHLPECESCQAEWKELRMVWEALPEQMDMIEPPKELKQTVMNAIQAAESEQAAPTAAMIANRSRRPLRRLSLTAACAALVLLLGVMTVWNIQLYRTGSNAPLPIEQALHVPAAQITRLVSLKPKDEEISGARGIACIIDNGQSRQFVVYVFGAPQTNGSQAYQVWLINNGQRTSAGTFRVEENSHGVGLLAMPITGELDFNSVGITLEPDDRGDRPRGIQMFGSV